MQRMRVSENSGLLNNIAALHPVMRAFTGIVKYKIQNLLGFASRNFINCQGYTQYKRTDDCIKLMKIAKEYNQRYEVELSAYWHNA